MTYDEATHSMVLSSGHRFYAYAARLSLPVPTDQYPELSLAYGHDGTVSEDDENESELPRFTAEEKIEIASAMIALWQRWAGMT